jgi:3-deoxy-D-manno-octulosonic-acid transferase
MEAEFWYLMFYISKLRGSKNILINARMSEKSYPKYLKYRWFYKKVFENIDSIYAQTQDDKTRLESLGAKNIKVTGNIKFHTIPKPTKKLDKPNALLVCAGSTHDKEESLILEAFRELKINKPNAKLVIAPRHPERFAKVDRIIGYYCELQKWSYKKYSLRRDLSADITLIDSLGELINLYAISDIVILGGAFEPIGGHNASEPAQFGCSIISGEHYFNQKDIFAGVEGIKIVKNSELKDVLKYPKLLSKTKITTTTDITPILKEIEEAIG